MNIVFALVSILVLHYFFKWWKPIICMTWIMISPLAFGVLPFAILCMALEPYNWEGVGIVGMVVYFLLWMWIYEEYVLYSKFFQKNI